MAVSRAAVMYRRKEKQVHTSTRRLEKKAALNGQRPTIRPWSEKTSSWAKQQPRGSCGACEETTGPHLER